MSMQLQTEMSHSYIFMFYTALLSFSHASQDKRGHISYFREGRFNKFGQLGWSGGFMGVTDFAFLHSHWKFLFATVLKRIVAKNLIRK
jgi:hypothetical protein